MFAVRYQKIFLALGALIMLGSIAIVGVLGLPLGIDFTGGALTEVAYDTRPDRAAVEANLNELDLGGYSLRQTADDTGRDGFILQTRDLTETERQAVETAVTSVGEGSEVTRFTSIGPVIGEELKDKAVWAIGAVVLVIILYVAFAFAGVGYPVGSWVYGSITIVALVHDVLVPTALISILGVTMGAEVDVLFVMAILAVLGYSVNDTIVVFDRVRENLKEYTKVIPAEKPAGPVVDVTEVPQDVRELTKPFDEIVGLSVQQTLVRSINTSLTTFLAIVALYFFGGEVTQTFALTMMAGVLAGTFSSIFFANPLLVAYANYQLKKQVKQ